MRNTTKPKEKFCYAIRHKDHTVRIMLTMSDSICTYWAYIDLRRVPVAYDSAREAMIDARALIDVRSHLAFQQDQNQIRRRTCKPTSES